jgi:hypothetical protein
VSPRFDYVDRSGIEFRWDGRGPLEAGIRSRTGGDFLYVDSVDRVYGQPATEENFRQLCEDFIRGGSADAVHRRLLRTRQMARFVAAGYQAQT